MCVFARVNERDRERVSLSLTLSLSVSLSPCEFVCVCAVERERIWRELIVKFDSKYWTDHFFVVQWYTVHLMRIHTDTYTHILMQHRKRARETQNHVQYGAKKQGKRAR